MTYYNPPHEVRDEEKLQSMITTLKSGKQLPPVVVCGENAYTGSHRLEAWKACEMEPEVVEISESEYILAVAVMNGFDDLNINDPDDLEFFNNHINSDIADYNEFCEALLKVSQSESVISAVRDQIG